MKRYVNSARSNAYNAPYGLNDVLRAFSNGSSNVWSRPEVEMDYGDGRKLADRLKKRGYHVVVSYQGDPDREDAVWAVVNKNSHAPYQHYDFDCYWTDAYFYPYGSAHPDDDWEEWE